MKLRLLLEAHDVWFFRTSRPFGATQAAASDGEPHLLPPPSAVFGAIRTALGERQRINWSAYRRAWANWPTSPAPAGLLQKQGPPVLPDGATWPTDAIRLSGCLPARIVYGEVQPLFPLPGFVLLNKEHGDPISGADLQLALPCPSRADRSSAGLWPVLPPDDFEGESCSLLADERAFAQLLRGRSPASFPSDGALVAPAALADEETRVGIARQIGQRTLLMGHLYSLQTHRWRSRVAWQERDGPTYGVLALVENVSREDLGERLQVRLGGEGRLAWGRVDKGDSWCTGKGLAGEVRSAIDKQRGWWLTLATPAAFIAGWHPSWIEHDEAGFLARLRAANGNLEAGRLVGLVSDEPLLHSGWDMAAREGQGRPRPVRRLMPAGTTWFFELPEGAGAGVLDAVINLMGTCIADEDAHAGWGLAFVGAWKRRDNG